ncbi:MAG: methyltransferase domain-containing protein [Pseudomonadota bacterium]
MSELWNVTRYNESKKIRLNAICQLIEWSGFQFNRELNILDVGCGNAIVDSYLCHQYPSINILGIDKDSHMIEAAGANNALSNLQFKKIDAHDITYKKEFDLVLSTAALHWIKEQDKVLANIFDALKSNGKALFIIYPPPPYLFESLDILINDCKWKSYFANFDHGYYFYDEQNYTHLAKEAGFTVNKIAMLKHDYKLRNQQDLEKIIASWLPHLKRLPNTLHQQFMRELCGTMLISMQKNGIDNFTQYRGLSLNVYLSKPC